MLIALGLLLTPGAYHRIVEEGEDTHELHRFTTKVMNYALLPFAVALGLDVYVSAEKTLGQTAGSHYWIGRQPVSALFLVRAGA